MNGIGEWYHHYCNNHAHYDAINEYVRQFAHLHKETVMKNLLRVVAIKLDCYEIVKSCTKAHPPYSKGY